MIRIRVLCALMLWGISAQVIADGQGRNNSPDRLAVLREMAKNGPPETAIAVLAMIGGYKLVSGLWSLVFHRAVVDSLSTQQVLQPAPITAVAQMPQIATPASVMTELAAKTKVVVEANTVHIHHMNLSPSMAPVIAPVMSPQVSPQLATTVIPALTAAPTSQADAPLSKTDLLASNRYHHSWWRNWLGADGWWGNSDRTKKLAFYAAAGTYAGVNALLIYRLIYLKNPNRWFLWKPELTLQQIVDYPRNVLGEQLMASCLSRYAAFEGQTYAVMIEHFLMDLRAERAALEGYQWWMRRLMQVGSAQRAAMAKISDLVWGYVPLLNVLPNPIATWVPGIDAFFCIDQDLALAIDEYLMKLGYLRTLFLEQISACTKVRGLVLA